MIRDVVADISREIAVVVVAHRLSTIRDAGQILVIENGRLRAHGTHEQLVEVDVDHAVAARRARDATIAAIRRSAVLT